MNLTHQTADWTDGNFTAQWNEMVAITLMVFYPWITLR